MSAIYKRELRAYYHSMIGWVFTAAMLILVGIYFMAFNMYQGYVYFSYALSSASNMLMLLVPVLTMRSMSEERASRTDQLLLTAPVSVGSIVLGKFLATLTVFAVPMILLCICPLIIRSNGSAALLADYCTMLAFLLLGGVLIALGMLISSLTESQLIAAVATFAALLVVFLWDGLVSFLPDSASGSLMSMTVLLGLVCLGLQALSNNWKISCGIAAAGGAALAGVWFYDSTLFENLLPNTLAKFSLLPHFQAFASDHVFDLSGVILYISLTALLLFLSVQVIQKRRWS
ncbi:MAG: ABC transporter [Ruminococcaceae bacterium]|nr:ABC transporter [Oscillospiraceae bacterium]